nr:MAG TPA: hypothetical protein [Caudoviricetes sp.]
MIMEGKGYIVAEESDATTGEFEFGIPEVNGKFDLWCLVELFGHSRVVGKCTEQNIAGANMLRVDVPATKNSPGFTRFLSAGAIYAINPISEDVAREMADNLQIQPVSVWDIKHLVDQQLKALQTPEVDNTLY